MLPLTRVAAGEFGFGRSVADDMSARRILKP